MNKNLHHVVKKLLTEIDAYRALSGDTVTAFGQRAMQDGSFIPRLMRGRTPNVATVDKVRDYIARNSKAARPRK